MALKKVGILTAGGLAPCLSSAVGGLIERYTEISPQTQILCYRNGYQGLLLGDSIQVTDELREQAHRLHRHGGSPIGNSRVKLTNVEDCVRRGWVQQGQEPQRVAADQLIEDGVNVLHTIGGDDTNTAAADLATFLDQNNYALQVIGLPKTVDNDIFPIRQSLGAWTAAEEGAKFFRNVVGEHSANPRMLIVHEVMGRHCGWLTAATALAYRKDLTHECAFVDGLGLTQERLDIHAVFIPEMELDLQAEAKRLKEVMDKHDCVNIFLSEGAGVEKIVQAKEAAGETLPRDAFGHVRLDAVNSGKYFGEQFAKMLGAEKVMVQKSGYFSRAARANAADLRLIQSSVDLAVQTAFEDKCGVIGHDEDQGNVLRAIEFSRIRGGKPFDVRQAWFQQLLEGIGQSKG